MNVYLKAQRQLAQKMDHDPDADDVAQHLYKPVKDVEKMFKLNERVTSVDVSYGKDSDKPLVNLISDEHAGPSDILQDEGVCQNLGEWLDQLTEKQREVIVRAVTDFAVMSSQLWNKSLKKWALLENAFGRSRWMV